MTEVDGVRERSPALPRHACLLTGDHQLAEDLLQSALASTFRHWRRLHGGARAAVSHRPAAVDAAGRGRARPARRRMVGPPAEGACPHAAGRGDAVGDDARATGVRPENGIVGR